MTAAADTQKFKPTFAMPLIAPPAAGVDPPTHYALVAAQCQLNVTNVVTAPEATQAQLASLPPPAPNGIAVTVANPASALADLVPFGTLYALMGGELTYVRAMPDTAAGSAIDLAPILEPPFSALNPTPKYPAPAGLDPLKPWGAFRLMLWGPDFKQLKKALDPAPACGAIYYLGVDEASANAALKLLAAVEYTQVSYDKAVADGKKPPFQAFVEGIKGPAYSTTPTYAALINDFVTELLNGKTPLLVKGGAPIGRAIEVTAAASGTNPATVKGLIELWFVNAAKSPAFIAPAHIFRGALGYDF